MADWLRIRNLGFSYGEKKIIDRFSFTAPVPGIVTCSGPSGCGKSTLGLLLSGHLTAQSGEIFLDENAVRRPSRRCIAVSQDDDLFPWMKMRDQLKFCASFPNTVADWGNLAKSLGMEAFEDLYPGEMSGGMRKRLALLRATVLMPRLLVLEIGRAHV